MFATRVSYVRLFIYIPYVQAHNDTRDELGIPPTVARDSFATDITFGYIHVLSLSEEVESLESKDALYVKLETYNYVANNGSDCCQ